ncbi:flagellar filament capping protein FliD [Paraburkholderia sp. LEh10]|uniref:flagellar filament capping protein FliD n=1 Tax=Paraburkholderia sp. LEh10 TaxID=2821353 RepID=UPI001AE3A904|nr:flagellar filament capping protein FliD [Paraburkholderia sp. LEh10]MBP0591187.1 flagellar filament capping protein FliD [Paraburkholderia sp. LEh10]
MTTTTSSTDTSSLLAQAAQSILSGSTHSSLDVGTLVQSLVTAKTAAQAATIANKQSLDNTTLSAIGQLQSALSALQSAASGLADGSVLSKLAATVSGSGLSATTSTGAIAGTHIVKVTSIASANIISSGAIPNGTSLGTGNFTIKVGNNPLTIALNGSETVSSLAAEINSAANNPGVTASVVNGTDGQHLMLTSKNTGSANAITLSADPTVLGTLSAGYTTLSAAQDAQLTVDGASVTNSTNSISGVIAGVTLNVSAASVGTQQTLTIASDTNAAGTAISNFVKAYNQYVSVSSSLSSYNSSAPAGSQAGPLLGDAMLNSITNGLANIISSGVTTGGQTYSLASIGLDLQPDGTIQVNSTTLQNALSSNSSAISALFNTTNGAGAALNTFVKTAIQTGGTLDARTQALKSDLSDLNDQNTQLQAYSDQLTAQYNAQFTALNNLMTTMQNNQQYLTQLFGGQNSAGTLATNK